MLNYSVPCCTRCAVKLVSAVSYWARNRLKRLGWADCWLSTREVWIPRRSPFWSGDRKIRLTVSQLCWSGRVLYLTQADLVLNQRLNPVSYTHLRAHETDSYLVCRLLL